MGAFQNRCSVWRGDRWVLPFFGRYRRALAWCLGLGLLAVVFAAGLMFASGYLICACATMPLSIFALRQFIGLVQIFGIGEPVALYFERLASHDWVLRMTSRLRLMLFGAVEREGRRMGARPVSGRVLGALAEDIENVQNLYLRTLFPLIIAWVAWLLVFALLGLLSLRIAACWLGLMGCVVLAGPVLSVLIDAGRAERAKGLRARLYVELTDNVLGVNDWICAGRGAEYAARLEEQAALLRAEERTLEAHERGRGLAFQLLYCTFACVLIAWAGGAFGGQAAAEPGSASNWIAAFALAFFPLIDTLAPCSQAALAVAEHTKTVEHLNGFSLEGEEPAAEKAATGGEIHFEDLHFSYGGAEVLRGLNLHVCAGQRLAVLGKSGCGKSTLGQLIWRSHEGVAVLAQESYLFNLTVRENLLLARPRATEEQLWTALEQVRLRGLIEGLPAGLDTLVDEGALRFSGGERRRLALARILLQDTPIVLLDEPTTALDPATEEALLETIFEALAGKTIVFITHHLAGVHHCDRVIFLEDGAVSLEGTPAQLAANSPRYQQLLKFDRGL